MFAAPVCRDTGASYNDPAVSNCPRSGGLKQACRIGCDIPDRGQSELSDRFGLTLSVPGYGSVETLRI